MSYVLQKTFDNLNAVSSMETVARHSLAFTWGKKTIENLYCVLAWTANKIGYTNNTKKSVIYFIFVLKILVNYTSDSQLC